MPVIYDATIPHDSADDASYQAWRDARHDFTATVNRAVAPGSCTGCETSGVKLFRYGREILCGGCMDTQLDLMAKAVIDLVPQADGSWAVAQ